MNRHLVEARWWCDCSDIQQCSMERYVSDIRILQAELVERAAQPEPIKIPEREIACPNCGYFLTSTTAAYGRIKAYCRGEKCRRFRTVYLGKPPELTEVAA